MQIFIMRHGDATLNGISDSVRPLSHCGCDETHRIAIWLSSQSVDVEKILVSPYLRAQQTLSTIREVLLLPNDEEVLLELTPHGDSGLVACYIEAMANKGVTSTMVISHLPLVSYLVAKLCPQEVPPIFETSAIACIAFDIGSSGGKLEWQISPAKLPK